MFRGEWCALKAARDFFEAVEEARGMTAHRARRKHRPIGKVVRITTPEEVIERLAEHGVKISRGTLQNYERWRLIPEPDRTKNMGRAGGKVTNFPNHTPAEVFAAWHTIHGAVFKATPEQAAQARQLVLESESNNIDALIPKVTPQGFIDPVVLFAQHWNINRAIFEVGGGDINTGVAIRYHEERNTDGTVKLIRTVQKTDGQTGISYPGRPA